MEKMEGFTFSLEKPTEKRECTSERGLEKFWKGEL